MNYYDVYFCFRLQIVLEEYCDSVANAKMMIISEFSTFTSQAIRFCFTLLYYAEAVLTSTHNLCFQQKYEKYQSFLSENFQFLEVKFSIYLKRHVFVMAHTRFVNGL